MGALIELRQAQRDAGLAGGSAVTVPVLILRGRDDRLLTRRWANELAALAVEGTVVGCPELTFPWLDPQAWSDPVRELAVRVGMP